MIDISFIEQHIVVAADEFLNLALELQRPSVMYRPLVYKRDGRWRAVYNADIRESVIGYGDTPEMACRNFDRIWRGEE